MQDFSMICPEHFVVMINPDEFDYGPSPRGFVAKIALFLPLNCSQAPQTDEITPAQIWYPGSKRPQFWNAGSKNIF
jgi:hypothetical protein